MVTGSRALFSFLNQAPEQNFSHQKLLFFPATPGQ
jgi:hypothetical protein